MKFAIVTILALACSAVLVQQEAPSEGGDLGQAVNLGDPDDQFTVQSKKRKKQTSVEVLDKFRYSRDASGNIENPASEHGGRYSALSPGRTVEFSLTSNEAKGKTEHFIAALQIVGGFIENALAFAKPVKVNITFGAKCRFETGCENNLGTLAVDI